MDLIEAYKVINKTYHDFPKNVSWYDIVVNERETTTISLSVTTSIDSSDIVLEDIDIVTDNDNGAWITVQSHHKKNKYDNYNKVKMIVCIVCKKEFPFSLEEQLYFKQNNWPARKRCKKCKKEVCLNKTDH